MICWTDSLVTWNDHLYNQAYGDDYRGLNSDHNTVAEVETAVQFFPNSLSQTGRHLYLYHIQCLTQMVDNNID